MRRHLFDLLNLFQHHRNIYIFFHVKITSNAKFGSDIDLKKVYFFPHLKKNLFFQVDIVTKIFESMILKYLEFFKYFNVVK